MALSGQLFAKQSIDLGLVADADMESVVKQLPPEKRDDAQAAAKLLIDRGKLTKYQAAAVYQGKGKELLFGDYVVLDRLGAGGMGQVFKARHRRMDRIVALKVIHAEALKNPDSVKRFEREVKAAAKLLHPNIVIAHDAGQQEGRHYLVMEFIDGSDLSTLLKRQNKLSVRQACDFIAQAAKGLAFAHGKGVVHRDIKPGNLLVGGDGVVKILDLGLARFDDGPGGATSKAEMELTQQGAVMGTVDYMAPEQAANTRNADAKSDVYGLGCTLFRLLTGDVPYHGDTMVERILAHRSQPIPPLRNVRPDAPPALEKILTRMLAKYPDARPTMQEVADGLGSLEFGAPGKSGVLSAGEGSGIRGVGEPGSNSGLSSVGVAGLPTAALVPNVGVPNVGPTPPKRATALPGGAAPVATTRTPVKPRRKSKLPLLLAAGAVAAMIGLGGWVAWKSQEGNAEEGIVEATPVVKPPVVPPRAGPNVAGSAAVAFALPTATGTAGNLFSGATVTTNVSGPPAVVPVPPPSVNVPPPQPIKTDPAAERATAEALFALKGRIKVEVGGQTSDYIENVGELPAGNFQIVDVNLGGKQLVNDDELKHVKNLAGLKALYLSGTSVSDDGLAALHNLANLETLYITSIYFTGKGLIHVSQLPKLRFLSTKGSAHTTNAGLIAGLSHVKQIGTLSLDHNLISTVQFVRGMTTLTNLDLAHTNMRQLAGVEALSNLKILTMSYTPLVDADLPPLKGLSQLERLSIYGSNVSDAGLVNFEGLASLKDLALSNTYVTEAGAASLRSKLPGCKITVQTKPGALPSASPPPQVAAVSPVATSTAVSTKVELLPLIRLPQNVVNGRWARLDTTVVGEGKYARVQVPFTPAGDEYDLVLTGKLDRSDSGGRGSVAIGIVSQGRQFLMRVGPYTCGISDGDTTKAPNYVEGLNLPLTTPFTARCAVRKGSVLLTVNNQSVLEYRGDFNALSVDAPFVVPITNQLFLSIADDARYEFTSFTLLPPGAVPASTTVAGPVPDFVPPPVIFDAAVERAAAELILSRGGTVVVNAGGRQMARTSNASLLPAGPFYVVVVGFAKNKTLATADIAALAKLGGVKTIEMNETNITDPGVAALASLKTLDFVQLGKSQQIRGPGIAALTVLPNLRDLRINEIDIDDAGVQTIRLMKNLEYFEASGNRRIVHAGCVAGLQKLRDVNFGKTSVVDLSPMGMLPELTNLRLYETPITDASLATIPSFPKLAVLNFAKTNVTDAGLRYLERFTNLTSLNFDQTYVTDAGAGLLQSRLPNCKIVWRTKAGTPPPAGPLPPTPGMPPPSAVATTAGSTFTPGTTATVPPRAAAGSFGRGTEERPRQDQGDLQRPICRGETTGAKGRAGGDVVDGRATNDRRHPFPVRSAARNADAGDRRRQPDDAPRRVAGDLRRV